MTGGFPTDIVDLQQLPTDETFDEARYLAAHADVAAAVAAREWRSGRAHFMKCGRAEGRRQLVDNPAGLETLRARKLAHLRPLFDRAPVEILPSGALSFLTETVRRDGALDDIDVASENPYDGETLEMIRAVGTGVVLDAGAGLRPTYFGNVVNLEILPYATTDVLATGDTLPFRDGVFDGILSIAVLEHVKDPFRCAAELMRVLKPGGWLKCCVPFLQPFHGYPHHYFNMTHEGLKTLFEKGLTIERQEVTWATHPAWSITWQLRLWADALPPALRKTFLRMRVEDLIAHPAALMDKPIARDLPMKTQFELAAATILIGRKPA